MEIHDAYAEIGKKFILREQLNASILQVNQEIQALYAQIQEREKEPKK